MAETLEEQAKRCPLKGERCDKIRAALGLVDGLQYPACPEGEEAEGGKDYVYLGCGFYRGNIKTQQIMGGKEKLEAEERAAEIATEMITGEDHGPLGPHPFFKGGEGPHDVLGAHPFRKY